jgi:hypothetical protein
LFLHQALFLLKRGEDEVQLDGVIQALLDTLSQHTRNMAVEKEGEKVTAKKEQRNFEENKLPQKQVEQLQEKLAVVCEKLAVEQQKVENLCEMVKKLQGKLEKERQMRKELMVALDFCGG